MKRLTITALLALLAIGGWALEWQHGKQLHIACDTTKMEPVVGSALRMFQNDYRRVLGGEATMAQEGDIVMCIDSHRLKGKWEAFRIEVQGDRLIITGSDSHGLAYGLLEVSRLMGVSPWEWWADVTPRPLERFVLPKGFRSEQAPDVQFRGIFINDEDWGMLPWATYTYEPDNQQDLKHVRITNEVANWEVMPEGKPAKPKGRLGPRTHSRIFELLLRLRANTFWPAMHECTEPFFLCDENRRVAQQYGIYIGTSHCEPMACNVNGEWRVRGEGEYDYINNAANVQDFWEKRVRDVASQPILYTLGMRGVHDGAMNGAKTVEEQKAVLERVLRDQRNMLRKHVDQDVTRVPQVFIPYKEVLEVYNAGLEVPEDVCLMWCDDNYGFIHHFPTAKERQRKGGNGVYYHVSYWGRPHDYLWLGTFSPALLMQQMTQAYDHEMRRMWILNVGDLKPAEYQTQLFMDMAWDIDRVRQQGVEGHLKAFMQTNVGVEYPGLKTYYRLAYQCKPEFLGGTRVEESNRKYWNTVRDMPWTEEYIKKRLTAYQCLENEVELLAKEVPEDRREAFFQLVKYPVQAASEMNKKMLLAQQARHGRTAWQESEAAYDSIASLTRLYNTDKWLGIMDFRPRQLPVFMPLDQQDVDSNREPQQPKFVRQGNEATGGKFTAIEQLGYEGQAVWVKKGKNIMFDLPAMSGDSIMVEVRLLPNHAIEGNQLRFQLRFDGQSTEPVNYETYGRSEEWKQNVLRTQAIRRFTLPINQQLKHHRLELQALDEGVVVDQIAIF